MKRLIASVVDGKGFDLLLVGIPLLFLILFSGLPLVYNIFMSFQEVDLFSLGQFGAPLLGWTITVPCWLNPSSGQSCGTRGG